MRSPAIFAVLAFLLAAAPTKADLVVDQTQPLFSEVPLAIGGASEQKVAQTVTAGMDGPLAAIQIPVGCDSGTLVVEIVALDGDRPGTRVLGRAEVPAVDLPAPPDFRTVVLERPVRMSAGDRFAIVLRNPTGICGLLRGPDGDSYSRGEGYFDARPAAPG